MADIEKPGQTPASATSRPIITSRGPAVKDPMVSEDAAEKSPPEPTRLAPSVTKKKIEPLAAEAPQPVKDVAPAEPEKQPEESPIEAPISEELSQLNADDAAAAAQVSLSKEEQEQDELVAKLAEEKKYFVPIGAVKKRRAAQTTLLLTIVLLLLLAGGVYAIDADLIETDIALPFDLIKSVSK